MARREMRMEMRRRAPTPPMTAPMMTLVRVVEEEVSVVDVEVGDAVIVWENGFEVVVGCR